MNCVMKSLVNKFLVYDKDTGKEHIISLEATTVKEAQNKVNGTFIKIIRKVEDEN